MIAAFCNCVYYPELLIEEPSYVIMCGSCDENGEESKTEDFVCAMTFDDDIEEDDDVLS